ncbi:MAG: B12-binding domain-containing radical SAM protein, partial [Candidatus Omnitrophota bacterium]
MKEELLLDVRRPAQYLGNEWNVSKKEARSCALSFALGFPDLYEIGMSNLGLRIIYGVINNIPDAACERFFSPGPDMQDVLKGSSSLLASWESGMELRAFDMMGFSLGSELNYTNVLNILELSGVPMLSSLRDNRYPLVVGGGPCTLNPEPLADFFDLFLVGEAEEAVVELIDLYREHKHDFKNGGMGKNELLSKISGIEGIYVPSLYSAKYDSSGNLVSFSSSDGSAARQVKKRLVGDLDSVFYPRDWVVPYVQTVHDRVSLEIMRGCPNRCRFCQARAQYYPLRL